MIGTMCPLRSTSEHLEFCQVNCALFRPSQTNGICAFAAIAHSLQELTETIRKSSELTNEKR